MIEIKVDMERDNANSDYPGNITIRDLSNGSISLVLEDPDREVQLPRAKLLKALRILDEWE